MNGTYYFIYNGDFVLVTGNYQWNSEIMENLGTSLEDYKEGKYVLLNEEQAAFLENHEEATPEEAWNMSISENASPKDIRSLVESINEYDTSAEVNTFYVNGTPVWFDKYARTTISQSISTEIGVGKETTVMWFEGTPYTMDINDAKQMFIDIELYAIECYNNTQKNIAEARTLTSKSEVANFDITKGYPEKLSFNL